MKMPIATTGIEVTIDYKQEFFNFLLEHNAYEEYMEEFERNNNIAFDLYFLPTEYNIYIDGAFVWSDTNWGHDTWCNINFDWEKHYESLRQGL